MTIVEARLITGGVDTHADMHVAAALDSIGGLLGVEEFPVTPAGYARLPGWLGGFGTVALVGIEGTGSYGAGLARYVTAAGIQVVEVDRSDRQDRRRQGKSDPLDAVSAARAAPSPAAPAAHPRAGTAPWMRKAPSRCPPSRRADPMTLFVTINRHAPERGPARDPAMGPALLSHLSPAAIGQYGVVVDAEAVADGMHTLYLIAEAADGE